MDMDLTPKAALRILRSGDAHDLYFYSQHIAVVVEDLLADVQVLHRLVEGLDQVEVDGMASPLRQVRLHATLSTQVLNNLLGVIANADID